MYFDNINNNIQSLFCLDNNNRVNSLLLLNSSKVLDLELFNAKAFKIKNSNVNKNFFLKNFLKQASSINNKKIFFFELELIGLGYRVSVKKNAIRLSLGYSHIIFVSLPLSLFFLKRKTKVLVYGFNLLLLSSFVSKLLRFKKLNSYKLKGLKKKSDIFILKPGKRTK